MIGAPVSTAAAATAARIRGTSPMRPCRSTAHLRKAALTPVSSMPSRISRTKNSAIASGLRYPKKFGSSRNAYTPVATTMLMSTSALMRWMRGMKRPSPGAVGSTIVSMPAALDCSQLLDRVGDTDLLVPVARTPHVPVVLERLRLEDEDVLVHQRRAELLHVDGSSHGFNGGHAPFLSSCRRILPSTRPMRTLSDLCGGREKRQYFAVAALPGDARRARVAKRISYPFSYRIRWPCRTACLHRRRSSPFI